MTPRASPRRTTRKAPRLLSWRKLRIALLALLLAVVALNSSLVRRLLPHSNRTQWVVVFPINADGSAVTTRYIKSLSAESFAPIEDYLAAQAQHYDITLPKPVTIRLGPELDSSPPEPPFGGGLLRGVCICVGGPGARAPHTLARLSTCVCSCAITIPPCRRDSITPSARKKA